MSTHPLAGKLAPTELLVDVSRLEAAFYNTKPDPTDPTSSSALEPAAIAAPT
jgi:phosphoglucomutase